MRPGPSDRQSAIRDWVRAHVPPGGRLVVGVLLMSGGVFGFLPILGFWMIPLGAIVAGTDIVPLWRRLRHRKPGK